jgi:hypothetical protein
LVLNKLPACSLFVLADQSIAIALTDADHATVPEHDAHAFAQHLLDRVRGVETVLVLDEFTRTSPQATPPPPEDGFQQDRVYAMAAPTVDASLSSKLKQYAFSLHADAYTLGVAAAVMQRAAVVLRVPVAVYLAVAVGWLHGRSDISLETVGAYQEAVEALLNDAQQRPRNIDYAKSLALLERRRGVQQANIFM